MHKRKPQRSTGQVSTELAENFVREYLLDFREVEAAVRCGIPLLSARATARALMATPSVAVAIQRQIDALAEDKVTTSNRVIASLLREAHNPDNHEGTRLSALRELAAIVRPARVPKGSGASDEEPGGIILVPGTSSAPSAWEAESAKMQAALKERVRE